MAKLHEKDIIGLNQKVEESQSDLAETKEIVEHLSFENQRITQEYSDIEIAH